jgi:maltose O-acetyltransferase
VPPSSRDHPATPVPRLGPGQEAGGRQPGLLGGAAALRRRLTARLRGEQDLDGLIARGLITVGREVFVARGFYFDPGFAWLISIGDQSTIGPNVTILTHDATPKLRTGWSAIAPVRIGARVFVGANTTILPGVEIGDDAIVGAGSVLRRDVAAGTVVTGNPAEVVGTTEEHTRRHFERLAECPRFQGAGFPPRVRERCRMLDQLGRGRGYVD